MKPTYRCVSDILAIDSKELRNFISPSSDDQIALQMHIACTGDIHRAKKVERDLRWGGRMSSSKDDVTICISIFYPVLGGKGGHFFRLFCTNCNSVKTTFCLFFLRLLQRWSVEKIDLFQLLQKEGRHIHLAVLVYLLSNK